MWKPWTWSPWKSMNPSMGKARPMQRRWPRPFARHKLTRSVLPLAHDVYHISLFALVFFFFRARVCTWRLPCILSSVAAAKIWWEVRKHEETDGRAGHHACGSGSSQYPIEYISNRRRIGMVTVMNHRSTLENCPQSGRKTMWWDYFHFPQTRVSCLLCVSDFWKSCTCRSIFSLHVRKNKWGDARPKKRGIIN